MFFYVTGLGKREKKKRVNENSEFMHAWGQEREDVICAKRAQFFDDKTEKQKKAKKNPFRLTSNHQGLQDVYNREKIGQ